MRFKKLLPYSLYKNIIVTLLSSFTCLSSLGKDSYKDSQINEDEKPPPPIHIFENNLGKKVSKKVEKSLLSHKKMTKIWTFQLPKQIPKEKKNIIQMMAKLKIEKTGFYTFILNSSYQSSLRINKNLIIQIKKRKKDTAFSQKGLIFLNLGVHSIHLEIVKNKNKEEFNLSYESQDFTSRKIPSHLLIPS